LRWPTARYIQPQKPAGDCLASGDHTHNNETDGHFGPDSDEFKLDAAAVAAEEAVGRLAVERKEARRVKPWLSELTYRSGRSWRATG
jgi:hypothetical protein